MMGGDNSFWLVFPQTKVIKILDLRIQNSKIITVNLIYPV